MAYFVSRERVTNQISISTLTHTPPQPVTVDKIAAHFKVTANKVTLRGND